MAAPTITKFQQYPSGQLPKLPYIMGAGFAHAKLIDSTFQWNTSGSGTNEYYLSLSGGGDPTATLTSNSILNPHFRFEQNGATNNNEMVWCDEGTIGSLNTYEFAYGDNDSLGYDTWYVRLPSGSAPTISTSVVEWDESTTGDGSDAQDCLFEWRCTSHPAGWSDKYRTWTDYKWESTLDWSEETWSSTKTSRIQAPSISAVLDAEGAYTFELRVTNVAGDQTTTEFSITVNTETRTGVVVDSGGGGDYTTLKAAIAAGEQLISIAGGHTEVVPSGAGVNWAGLDNVSVEWDGTGGAPVFTKTASAGRFINLVTVYGCMFYGLDFKATGTSNTATEVFTIGRSRNIAIVGCNILPGTTPSTDKIGFFIKLSGVSESEINSGLLVQGCGSASNAYEDYWFSVNSYPVPLSHTHVVGCYVPNSPTEQPMRFNVLHPNIAIIGSYIDSELGDSLRIGDCNMAWVHGNKITGTVNIGSFVARPIRPYRVRVSANYGLRDEPSIPLGQFINSDNGKDTTWVNCIANMENEAVGAGSGASNPGESVTTSNPFLGYAGISGNKVVNCTVIKHTGVVDAYTGAAGTYVTDNIIKGCIVHTPSDSTWSGTSYDLNDYTAENNDSADDYELTADFIPTGATALTKYGEAYDDFWGNVRSSTTVRGAVEMQQSPAVVNRTPAGGSTGITEAATISLQFDQNMAVDNTSATIELRLVSDDSVVDSITASDATINISDRTQVTLTGLSTVGATGSVYVYVPADAFKSAVTGVSYEGDLTNTDWSFTMLAVVTTVSAPARGRARRRTR